MSDRYQDYRSFRRKVAAIERELNNKGYQTEDNERECWLGVTRYRQQAKLTHFFIMEESIGRCVNIVQNHLRYA